MCGTHPWEPEICKTKQDLHTEKRGIANCMKAGLTHLAFTGFEKKEMECMWINISQLRVCARI